MLRVKRFLKYKQKFLGTVGNQETDISRTAPLCFLFIVIALILSCKSSADAVPVMPNKAVVMSIVREHCLTSSTLSGMSPEQVLFRVVISVEEVEDVKGYPNFLKDKEGQNLSLFYKRKKYL